MMNKNKNISHSENFYNDEDIIIEEDDDTSLNEDVQALLENNKQEELKEEVNEIFEDLDNSTNVTKAYSSEKSQSVDTIKNNFKLQNKVVNAHCDNITSDIKIKKDYSTILLVMLAIQFIILDGVFVFAGLGILKYSDISLNLFITAGLIELIGLVAIIVKYLFKDNTTESLRIISHINDKS